MPWKNGQGRDGMNGGQRDRQVCHHQLRGIENKRTASG